MQIHELNNYSGSIGDAYLAADNGSDTGKMKTTALTDPLNARIDNIIAGPAPSAAEIVDARRGENGVNYPSLGDAIRGQFEAVGNWQAKKIVNVTARFPYFQIEPTSTKIYVNIIKSDWVAADGYTVRGSNDGWQTQTTIQQFREPEFVCDIGNTYSSIRIAINGETSITGNAEAIIYEFDDTSIARFAIDNYYTMLNNGDSIDQLKNFDNMLSDGLNLIYVADDPIAETRVAGLYLDSGYKMSAIGNVKFVVKQYPVLENHTYQIVGDRVRLNAALPLAAFGVNPAADLSTFEEIIINGTTTTTDYNVSYMAPKDGYIFIAAFTDYNEAYTYNAKITSSAIYALLPNLKIQLFGDSLTDNQWGDLQTWANFITNYFGNDTVIVNDAVGGCGIGHGKSETTPSHQADTYNYVWDLVRDGVTLQTDADVIVILVGTNNWASGTPLGDMSSSGYSTIYGALKDILDYISQNSAATVFVCTIPQRYDTVDQGRTTNAYGEPLNSNGVSLADYCEAFRKVSAFYGMPCVHLNEALGWNRLNISDFTTDGLHPNAKGDKMLAAFICQEIKKHV